MLAASPVAIVMELLAIASSHDPLVSVSPELLLR